MPSSYGQPNYFKHVKKFPEHLIRVQRNRLEGKVVASFVSSTTNYTL